MILSQPTRTLVHLTGNGDVDDDALRATAWLLSPGGRETTLPEVHLVPAGATDREVRELERRRSPSLVVTAHADRARRLLDEGSCEAVLWCGGRVRASRRLEDLRRVLVPISAEDEVATLGRIASLAAYHEAEAVLVHAMAHTEGHLLGCEPASFGEAVTVARSARRSLFGVRVQTVVEEGSPSDVILSAARERIDLVVMSRGRRSRGYRWLFGSVTERVLSGCEAPVLVVARRGRPT